MPGGATANETQKYMMAGATQPLASSSNATRNPFKKVFFCFFFSPQEKKKIKIKED